MRKNWAVLALWGVLAALLVQLLILNDGVFVYSLDDPYIHLQFSTQIARGHFGLLPQEISSPSSSVLWPLLLAPFSFLPFHEFVPLAINVVAVTASLLLWRHALFHFVLSGDDRLRHHQASALALAALLMTNGSGLVLSGMEHPLQLTATLAALVGAIELIETRRIRWWLIAGVIAGPLIRFENIPVSATALAVMLASGAWLWAVLACGAIIAGLGAFAAVSLSAGLPALPGSIRIKTLVGQRPDNLLAEIRSYLGHFFSYMLRGRWISDGLPVIGFLLGRPFLPLERLNLARLLLLGGIIGTFLAQLIFGAHYNLGRYDSFSFNAALLGIAYFYREALARLLAQTPPWRAFLAILLIVAPTMPRTGGALLLTPRASQDIYRQQVQMRGYLMTVPDEGVAVHDIGLVSYRTGQRILDLIALGSEEMRRRRQKGEPTGEDVAAIMRERRINAVLVPDSDARFEQWEQAAVFNLGRNPVSVVTSRVVLYGIDAAAAARLRAKAIEYAPSMPAGTTLEIVPAR